jgi:diguanylate cyclase (GGDEF)-like protein
VNHPDPAVRRRGRNALIVIYAILVIAIPTIASLTIVHNGRQVAGVATIATALMVGAALLIRRGFVDAAIALFFCAFLGAMLASALLTGEGRLTAIYCAMPVAVAGVTVNRRGIAAVSAAALAIGAWATFALPNDTPVTEVEVMVAAVTLTAIAVTSTVLGLYGQRQETARADALASSLRTSNDQLEQRVSDRTEQLQHALDRQEQLVAELNELSLRDPLTGLHNRRHADAELPRLVAAADRYEHPLAMAMADLDRFKRINDDHSYQVGDAVLRTFAQILRETTRSSDVVTRYGGEEFLILMPQTSLSQALVLCERIRHEVEAHDWGEVVDGLAVTVSIGVSDSVSSGGLVTIGADADAALHRAKRGGRNRVVAAHQGIHRSSSAAG